ncbi:scavenger receptor class B, member, variant 2 [Chamberlinius hualienensis]
MACSRACCHGPKAATIAAAVGAFFCVGFGITFNYIPEIINSMVTLAIPLSPSSFVFPIWQKIPFALYRQIWLFNFTNADDFENWGKNGVRPIVQQIGPYTYMEFREKVFLDWDEPPYVKYRETHKFIFNPDMSNGTEDDWVTIPNPVSVLINKYIPAEGTLHDLWNYFLTKPLLPIFKTVRVGELLYYGYDDPLLKVIYHFLPMLPFPDGKVAIMYGKNATNDGKYKINTGTDDITKMYEIVEWNDSPLLPYWGDQYCNMINGSDGTMYGLNVKKDSRVYAFVSNVKRTISLNYTCETSFHGIDGYGFTLPLDFYGDVNVNPDNHCFCFDDHEISLANGLAYMGPILLNTSIYASNPHFLGADFRLVDAIDGMEPNKEHHTLHMDIHPELGIPLIGNLRIQGNFYMQPSPNVSKSKNWNNIVLPIAWVNESAGLDDATIHMLNHMYYGGEKLVYSLTIICLIISGLICLIGIGCAFQQSYEYVSLIQEEMTRQPQTSC